jgi:predicted ATPase
VRVDLFDGPIVTGPSGPLELSPFQTALLAVVFTEGEISRPQVARILWGTDADASKRKRIRQLVHKVRRRVGPGVFEVRGDLLSAGSGTACDVRSFEEHLQGKRLFEAAEMLDHGFMPRPVAVPSDAFDDWRAAVSGMLRQRVERAAQAGWTAASSTGDRLAARDAAEALYALRPGDAEVAARVIEARARVGRMQAAEIAWAEYLDRVGRGEPAPVVQEAINRVRNAFGRTPADQAQDQVPFVGRRPFVAQLESVVRQVREGRCTFALIMGEAGIGKTRLLEEVARSASLDGVRCLTARPVELERRISLNPLIDALSEVDVDRHLTDLGEPWRTVVGATLPRDFLKEPVSAPPPIDDEALSRRLLDAFSLLLESVAREQATILFIDDLHWADATTVAALHFFRRRWEGVPFGLVATVRPDRVGRRDPLTIMLADDEWFPLDRVEIAELEEDEGRAILKHIGGEQISTDAADKLLALSGMHPLYLTELTRDFLAGRLELPESRAEALTLPISLRQILAARTEVLSPTAAKVAQVLAVGSKPMRIADLGRLLDRRLDEVVDSVDELRHGRLAQLERDRVWIAHDLFKSAIYSGMSDARRAVLHARLAELIAKSGGDEQANELAIHYDRAGEARPAARHGWTAGERAMIQGAIAEAAYFFELVARNEDNPKTKAEATANYALAYHLGRKMKRANPALELASVRLREVGLLERARRMDILRVEGLAEDGDTPVDELVARLSGIKTEARGSEDWEAVALALDAELRLQDSLGNLEQIRLIFAEMRMIARHGGADAAAVCHLGLAMGAVFGNPEEGVRSADQALILTQMVPRHRLKALWRYLVVQNH